MVNANEWLDEKIPKNQRAQATQLYIYRQCQSGHTTYQNGCNYCNNKNNIANPPQYQFYSTLLEGELDLNDFVNLQYLYIYGAGRGQDQQQKLTHLKIDKCNKLMYLQFNNASGSNITIGENKIIDRNKQLITDRDRFKSQVEKLTNVILNIKGFNPGDLKLAAKKIEEENLEHQISITKSKFNEDYQLRKNKLNEDDQLWLDILLETQQEVLQNDNAFARKLLEKVKNRLSNVLTAEEIQELLGKKVEINELEIQLNNLKIQEQQQQ
ncbi:12844_t:CDS:1 [Gigaspora margarita]|uniref:12844_t:CDS:1 n=1 Tax=Gigaspora margarita TaxID=4874 RepID=A0ABM8VZ59_GIGMA|nr:12844_t:CDS:1 [Gigaspora margarita]